MTKDERYEAILPLARGFIDAVKQGDKGWIKSVCQTASKDGFDLPALLVALAGEAINE